MKRKQALDKGYAHVINRPHLRKLGFLPSPPFTSIQFNLVASPFPLLFIKFQQSLYILTDSTGYIFVSIHWPTFYLSISWSWYVQSSLLRFCMYMSVKVWVLVGLVFGNVWKWPKLLFWCLVWYVYGNVFEIYAKFGRFLIMVC